MARGRKKGTRKKASRKHKKTAASHGAKAKIGQAIKLLHTAQKQC